MPKKPNRGTGGSASEIGKKGGLKGGNQRAKKLTSSERSNIASKGGQAKSKNNKKKS